MMQTMLSDYWSHLLFYVLESDMGSGLVGFIETPISVTINFSKQRRTMEKVPLRLWVLTNILSKPAPIPLLGSGLARFPFDFPQPRGRSWAPRGSE